MEAIEIKNLSIMERLQMMEEIWDSLLYEGYDIESPEWHRTVLEERKRKIESGTAEFYSIRELKKSFNG